MKKNTKKTAKNITIKSSFSGGTLTNYSGMLPVYKFMTKIGLPQTLDTISLNLHHNAQTSNGDMLTLITLAIMCGMNRISKIEQFTLDPLVQKLFNLPDKISDSGIIDRLKRFGMKQSTEYMQIIGEMSNKVHHKLQTGKDILDLDSSVKTVYGNQQGAEKGFNEKKKGAKSYHPLLAFLNSTRMSTELVAPRQYIHGKRRGRVYQAVLRVNAGKHKIFARKDGQRIFQR